MPADPAALRALAGRASKTMPENWRCRIWTHCDPCGRRHLCTQVNGHQSLHRFVSPCYPKGFATLADIFWARVERAEGEGCWLWSGKRDALGYGWFRGDRRKIAASRMAWEFAFGRPPRDREVCHQCDNPPCVRPDHLFLGTHLENMRDAVAKGPEPSPAATAELQERAVRPAAAFAGARRAPCVRKRTGRKK